MSHRSFATSVVDWYHKHGRSDLPWQENPTPYRVWISEIMLQQTQVSTVIPYFRRFIDAFPDVGTLADAQIDDVLHLWSGLGYYARARNLHKTAIVLRDEFDEEFPSSIDEIVALPGIGRSTGAAILSLSRHERHAILDGNVKRVLARYHAVPGWPGKTSVANMLWEYAERHTPTDQIAAYTQAMMDLGATVCTGTQPKCRSCPLVGDCVAYSTDRQCEFPGKREKKAKPFKKTQMVVAHCGSAVYLERRPAAGIWGGLWSFPELDTDGDVKNWCRDQLSVHPQTVEKWDKIKHSFTHFDLEIAPIAVRINRRLRRVTDSQDVIWYDLESPQQLGIAAPVNGLIRKLKGQSPNVQNRQLRRS